MAQLDKSTLFQEWQVVPKDWYSIYQWQRTKGCDYTEWISEWIEASISQIRLVTDGLRQRSFRWLEHRGQIKLGTDISQITEKRLLRAMFNLSEVPLLGKVIDYEVPLKENSDADHGDIDLLCLQNDALLCVEAKKPGASESILKAILQAFVYTSLIGTCRERFLSDFGLPTTLKLTPVVLTFASAQSGRQLKTCETLPTLLRLIGILDSKLEAAGINPIRFYIVEDNDIEFGTWLTITEQPNGDKKAVFRDGCTLNLMEFGIPWTNRIAKLLPHSTH